MSAVEITSLSSKGQVVIPNSIRNDLNVVTGTKFAVISDGTNILLQPINIPKISVFKSLIEKSKSYAKEFGLKQSDVASTIKRVRRENRN